jgi:hypothetical protein
MRAALAGGLSSAGEEAARCAVGANQILMPTEAQIVDHAGDNLLACAGFAKDQHSGVRGGNGLELTENSLQSWTLSNEFHGRATFLTTVIISESVFF